MKYLLSLLFIGCLVIHQAFAQSNSVSEIPKIETAGGTVKGISDSGIRIFKGIPFAKPPTGELRWKPPQPVDKWTGVRQADQFQPRCMQRRIFSDMNFRSKGPSEDCLYLNVWTPANENDEDLPVMVYFYGGGFIAGSGAEYRYDGESMARNKGIVVVTANYRLGVFGFLSHPALTQESPRHASGDYGLLDQVQALRWVKKNVADFGGDPNRVTIAGESAGSISVSALMASPLSKDLFRSAIGESGSILGSFSASPLSSGEETGKKFQAFANAKSLDELRQIPADSMLKIMARQDAPRFPITIDGYFLPKSPADIYSQGEQAQVPLLVGWNSGESNYMALFRGKKPTPENYKNIIQKMYGENAREILTYYPGSSKKEVIESATALASDLFIAYSTWKWSFMQSKTGDSPVYRYYYSRSRPAGKSSKDSSRASFAVHSAEIEYVMGNLPKNQNYNWTADDYKVSNIMQTYFANFVKTGNPNGLGLPRWQALNSGNEPHFMHIDVHTRLERAKHRDRHLFLDQISK